MTFADLKRFVEDQSARGLHPTTPVRVAWADPESIDVDPRQNEVTIHLSGELCVAVRPPQDPDDV